MTRLVPLPSFSRAQPAFSTSSLLPVLIAAAGEHASLRFLEFFAANIRNPHTRRAYGRAVTEFLACCDDKGVPAIADVQPLHVAGWIKQQTRDPKQPRPPSYTLPHCATFSIGW